MSLRHDAPPGRIISRTTIRIYCGRPLACKGIDQRIIDALMGHPTEEMKKRYQHLFPKSLKRTVEELLT
jgi:hypothetical protein